MLEKTGYLRDGVSVRATRTAVVTLDVTPGLATPEGVNVASCP